MHELSPTKLEVVFANLLPPILIDFLNIATARGQVPAY